VVLSIYQRRPTSSEDFTGIVRNPQIDDSLEPRLSQTWANASIKYAHIPAGDDDDPRFVPLVSIISGMPDATMAKKFVAVWRTVKHLWLKRVFDTRRPPEFATGRGWRSFAFGTFSTPGLEPDETSAVCIEFSKYLGLDCVLSLDRERYSEPGQAPGSIDIKVSVEMIRETVSELADLNFFFDMFEVEHELGRGEPQEIFRRMAPVMRSNRLILVAPICRSSLDSRGAWLMDVYSIVENWPGSTKPDQYTNVRRPFEDPSFVRALEATVADLYCYNVTHVLHRHPVVPRY
jgi:hypothetical protein